MLPFFRSAHPVVATDGTTRGWILVCARLPLVVPALSRRIIHVSRSAPSPFIDERASELQCWQSAATEVDRYALWVHWVGQILTSWAERETMFEVMCC